MTYNRENWLFQSHSCKDRRWERKLRIVDTGRIKSWKLQNVREIERLLRWNYVNNKSAYCNYERKGKYREIKCENGRWENWGDEAAQIKNRWNKIR